MASDKNFLTLWCEYDYGQSGVVFHSKESAKRWLDAEIREIEGDGGIDGAFAADLFHEGLAGVDPVSLIAYDDLDP